MLVQPSAHCVLDHDEGDIEDGEFWGDVEDSECSDDLVFEQEDDTSTAKEMTSQQEENVSHDISNQQHEVLSPSRNDSDQRPVDTGEMCRRISDQQNEHDAVTLASILAVLIVMWSYRFNITSSALDALLKLFKLFFSLLSKFSFIQSVAIHLLL